MLNYKVHRTSSYAQEVNEDTKEESEKARGGREEAQGDMRRW